MNNNILQYESKIWATADLLRGCGIKESEWPSFMMPFFALTMIESRLVRMFDSLKAEIGEKAFANIAKDDLYDMIKDQGQGYNIFIFEKGQSLTDICKNDKSFEIDFDAYLKGFDGETKDLLGVDASDGEKFLDIKGVINKLKAKKILLDYTKLWADISMLQSGSSVVSEQIEEEGLYPVYGGNGLRGYFSEYTNNGDYILIGRQGALCGNINYASGKFWASEHAVVVYLNRGINMKWYGEMLRVMNLNQYSVSAAQPGLAVDRIKRLLLPVPPFPEQQAIAAYLDEKTAHIDRIVATINIQIDKLKELRKTLINDIVTGKICVFKQEHHHD